MSLLLTLLVALGITVVVCVLLLCGPYLLLLAFQLLGHLNREMGRLTRNLGIKDIDAATIDPKVPALFFAFVFVLVLAILHLPPYGRVFAAIGATPLVVGVYLWICRTGAFIRS